MQNNEHHYTSNQNTPGSYAMAYDPGVFSYESLKYLS